MERTFPVVDARIDKVRQHIITVGSADEFVHRQAHELGVEPGQNIPKVPGRNGEVDGFAVFNPAAVDGFRISAEIVYNLGNQPAPVDGVGRGEGAGVFIQFFSQFLIAKEFLYAGLGIVEIAFHRNGVNVVALLGNHLQFLDVTNPFLGIEHDDFRFRHIGKACHGRLARIPGGSHQNHQFSLPRSLPQPWSGTGAEFAGPYP